MIYDFPEPSSPIGQGDIFFGVPILDLTDDELPIIDDEGNARTLPWEAFASAGENVSAVVAVRPTIAIVGTQECDALRAPNITLFEVRPFREVERKSKDTSKPSKWVPLITQHARINQKWFYLPADERLGFGEKMGADFLTPIRVPRLTLERLLSFRKGRLNEIAKQHFRERLSEFFRRYAYDEWYPLTREELAEYHKNHPDAEPFPWQHREITPQPEQKGKHSGATESPIVRSKKGRSEYEADVNRALDDIVELLTHLVAAGASWKEQLEHHTASVNQLGKDVDKATVTEFYLALAFSRDSFSERIEGLLPTFEKSIEALERSFSKYLLTHSPDSGEDAKKISNARYILSGLSDEIRGTKVTFIKNRDHVLAMEGNPGNINERTAAAIKRQAKAFEDLISNAEEFESFALKMLFLIDEKFGELPPPEDKAK